MRFYISCRFQFGAGCAAGANWAGIAVSSAHFARPFKWASAAVAASGFASERAKEQKRESSSAAAFHFYLREASAWEHSFAQCYRTPLSSENRPGVLPLRRWRQLELWPCDAILSPDIHALCALWIFSQRCVFSTQMGRSSLSRILHNLSSARLTKGAGQDHLDDGPLGRVQQVRFWLRQIPKFHK